MTAEREQPADEFFRQPGLAANGGQQSELVVYASGRLGAGVAWLDALLVLVAVVGATGAGLAFALFGRGVTMGAVIGGLAPMQVTPDLAFAGMFAIFTTSLAAAIVPVFQAIKISPALAFRKVI